MTKFGDSQTTNRREDVRFLTGAGRYIDDVPPADALRAFFLRSPMAHADFTLTDLEDARAAPGVHLVLTAEDLEAAGVKLGMEAITVRNRDGSNGAAPLRPILAKGRVRFVGEAMALIVADTLAAARDASEMIGLDLKERAPHMAITPGGPDLHSEAPDNVAYDWALGDEAATREAFAKAAHRVSIDLEDNRVIVNSMEPRGAWATWDGTRLHVAIGSQGVWGHRDRIATALGLDADAVHVTTPDVGGGFGMKAMAYPEYFAISQATRMLGKPVRWIADRSESMQTDNAGRDLTSTAELAFDKDLKITAYRVMIHSNLGAYNSQFGQPIQSEVSSKVLTGLYDVQTAFVNTKGIYTNTAQVDAYRGAGRPEAIYTLERCMDAAARQLGVDPIDLRMRNFIRDFPYKTASGELYDVGDFPRVLNRLAREADVAGFPARKAEAAKRGKLRGLGICCYIEAILGDPTEGATVEFNEDGTVTLYVGTQSTGQGHETVYAQFLSDRTGIPFDRIIIVQGDSDRIAQGGGTGGSRSVTTQSVATMAVMDKTIAAFTPFLADELGVEAGKISFADGTFRAEGSNRTPTLIEAADLARAAGRLDLLRQSERSTLPARSYPNGAHAAEVEVDPETGVVKVLRYTVTDDFGALMHPRLAEGQVHGGVAQGLGQALVEHAFYDETGQLITATFMDYAMPRADDMPMITFTTESVPSTANPLGMKGCGEAGTVGSMASVANAVRDALAARGVEKVDMPFTPLRVWTWLQEAPGAAA
ncbi:MAG: xanthine dehydrogenase family protein [Rhodobacteraceae bacterium]|nr:xanthine dehydrogenase family protein [Paracoccaceae bacterium]